MWRTTETLSANRWSYAYLAVTSILMGAIVMTRPDGVIAAGISWIACAVAAFRLPDQQTNRVARVLSLTVPAVLLLGGWLIWKFLTYGHLAPNTVEAKLGADRVLMSDRGLGYASLFFVTYWLAPLLVHLTVFSVRRMKSLEVPKGYGVILAYLVVWPLYLIWIGGDIMEFRHMVPAIPVLFVTMMWWMRSLALSKEHLAAVITIMLIGNAVHAGIFPRYVIPKGIGNVPQLAAWVDESSDSWATIGRRLGDDLEHTSDVTIAVIPAGAIPYYSRSQSIDMIGLNDSWVARNGRLREKCGLCFAHMRLATIEYMKSAGVNLILGFPTYVPHIGPDVDQDMLIQAVRDIFWDESLDYHNLPAHSYLVRIPIAEDLGLAAIYIKRQSQVDRLI